LSKVITHERTTGKERLRTSIYHEFNLVLESESKINVLSNSNAKSVRDGAKKLATVLNIQLWDGIRTEFSTKNELEV